MSGKIYGLSRNITEAEIPPRAVLGNKGHSLFKLCCYGFDVPEGFVIPAQAYFDFSKETLASWLKIEIGRQIARINDCYPNDFGDGSNEILFSVRSSPVMSMPGILNTVLNVGMLPDSKGGVKNKIKQEEAR